MESNPSGFHYRTVDDMKLYGDKFCSLLNCSTKGPCDTTCMRAASAQAVGAAWDAVGNDIWAILIGNWGHLLGAFLDCVPVVDGTVVCNYNSCAIVLQLCLGKHLV